MSTTSFPKPSGYQDFWTLASETHLDSPNYHGPEQYKTSFFTRNPHPASQAANTIKFALEQGGVPQAYYVGIGQNITKDSNGVPTGGTVNQWQFTNATGEVLYQATITAVSATTFYHALADTDGAGAYVFLVSLLDDNTTATGSAGTEIFEVGAGNDTVTAGGGDDAVRKWKAGNLNFNGGEGSDTLILRADDNSQAAPAVGLVVNLATGVGTNPYGGTLTLTSIENVIGTSLVDTIDGSTAANTVGDETTGIAGDTIHTSSGNDTVVFGFDGSNATVDGGTNTDTLLFAIGGAVTHKLDLLNQANNSGAFAGGQFTNFESYGLTSFSNGNYTFDFNGSNSGETVVVRGFNIVAHLNGGNDTLRTEFFTTTMTADGGSGTDTLIAYGQNYPRDVLDLVTPANNTGRFANATFTGFEIFTMSGGGIDFRGSNANETVNAAASSFTDDIMNGGGGTDVLRGRTGKDALNGGTGADTMIGGVDNDTYVVDNVSDVVDESADGGTGTETVLASISFSLADTVHVKGSVERLTLTGSALTATGNALANTLTGNALANTLTGGGSSDILRGGAGNDTYFVESLTDIVDESVAGSTGTDLVKAAITYSLADTVHVKGTVENLTLLGTGAINGTGNGFANYLLGNGNTNILNGGGGADVVNGGGGADILRGGADNDIYIVENVGDVADESVSGSTGVDTVQSFLTFSLADTTHVKGTIERLILLGTGNINGTGNGGSNAIYGNSGANVLIGNVGNDALTGNGGKDTMTGGVGNDRFDFNAIAEIGTNASNQDVITDFTAGGAGDDLDFASIDANGAGAGFAHFSFLATAGAAFTAAGQLRWFQSGGNTFVEGNTTGTTGAEFQLKLTGLKALVAGDFILV